MAQAALSNVYDARPGISRFMNGFTLETTPASAAKIANFREIVRPETPVYITFLPGSDFGDTITLAKRLRSEGIEPVPHFAARSLPDLAYVESSLARLRDEAGVTRVLLVGGAVPKPVGSLSDTMQILESGLLDKYGIRQVGLAGHPEGSPDISDEGIRKALAWKNAFRQRTDAKLYLVTQFCFQAAPIIAWDKRIRAEGNHLPIHVGVPGLATIKTLIGHAKACGIGPSMVFLTKHALNVAKLLTVSAPDGLVADLAAYKASDPNCGIEGVHMYPLGGLKKSAEWSYAVTDGRFTMNAGSDGFEVMMPA